MTLQLPELPTMIEAKNLEQLEILKKTYNKAKEFGELTFNTDFVLLRSKENDLMAYFHHASKNPSIKETVEWMQQTDNLSFPGDVSIMQGIKDRYDEKFHAELEVVVREVMDEFVSRQKFLSKMAENHDFIKMITELAEKIDPDFASDKPSVKIK